MKKEKFLNFNEFLEYVSSKLQNVKNNFPELNLDESHLFTVLMISYDDSLKLESFLDIYEDNIFTVKMIDSAVDGYNFNQIFYEVNCEIEFPLGIIQLEEKAKIKSKGKIFLIHRNDIDPFPSDPHAHQLDNNLKIDLSNGKCYRIKKHLTTLKQKDLLLLRSKAIEIGFNLPKMSI